MRSRVRSCPAWPETKPCSVRLLKSVSPLLRDRQGRLQLADQFAHSRDLGSAMGLLGRQLGELGLHVLPFGTELRARGRYQRAGFQAARNVGAVERRRRRGSGMQ